MSIKIDIPIYFTIIFLHLQIICVALPIFSNEDYQRESEDNVLSNAILGVIFGIICGICLILAIGICVCCDKNYFKFSWHQRREQRAFGSNLQNGFLSNGHEITIFPPPGAEQYLSSSTSNIHFEPLPDITSQLNGSTRPPRLSASVSSNLNEDWFAEPYKNFPRNQLQYVRKLGSGWFGQVLEGRAIGVDTDHTSTVITKGDSSKAMPVVVKALREDASMQEQALFLQELIPYRDLNHENILKIVAYCIETQPLLVLLQYFPKGDLKSVLKKDGTLTDIILLKMAENVSAGLSHMHQNDFIHTDVAARNCLVENDLNVKIGDYGFSVETYQNEYYLAENIALPIRWCAPETLRITETAIETIELNKSANVWSFGVLLWEIFSRGKLPYDDLDEDSVIQKVVLERSSHLRVPPHIQPFCASKLNEILDLCFLNEEIRPFMSYLNSLLQNLSVCLSESSSEADFEERWSHLSDNAKNVDQHNIPIADASLEMRFESDFTPRENLAEKGSPTPSLRNLHGSAEDLDARIAAKFGSALPSWLGLEPGQAMDSLTEEISDAIQRLDEALSEDRSESTVSLSSPEKTSFRLGSDSLVLNPPTVHRTLSTGDDENLTMRLEQGEFSELVRLKSQSVQDFMRLTVVDDGSDSDKTSQPGSLQGDCVAPSHRAQEKAFSSEGNLKEAARDAGFMVELERLQASHKFSIISEASREGMPSIEGNQFHVEGAHRLLDKDSSVESNDDPNFAEGENGILGQSSDFSGEQLNFTSDSVLPAKEQDTTQGRCEVSPDCVVSSRGNLSSAPLPDIVAHDANFMLSCLSDSSMEEKKTIGDALEPADKAMEVSNKENQVGSSIRNTSHETSKFLSEDENETDFSLERNVVPCDANQTYSPEKVILGDEVVIGALDDYSLEPFKPAKSNSTDEKNVNGGNYLNDDWIRNQKGEDGNDSKNFLVFNSQYSINDIESSLVQSNLSSLDKLTCPLSPTKTEEHNPFKMNGLINLKQENAIERLNKIEKLEKHLTNFDKNIGILIDHQSDFEPSVETKENLLVDHETQKECEEAQIKELPLSQDTPYDVESIPSVEKRSSRDENETFSEKIEPNLKLEADNPLREPSEMMNSNPDNLTLGGAEEEEEEASCSEMKSGEFWERQMVAWQEAAEQTRALLQAAHTEEGATPLEDSTRSPNSSQKSPFSSTDRLDDTDEEDGVYISYDTTDDDDVVRFSNDDLLALRSELHLKLPDATEDQKLSDEEPTHEHVFINYKSGCALSPIKEEDHHHPDFCEAETENSSIEFMEGKSVVIPALDLDLDRPITPTANLNLELDSDEAKDSLIFQDLECEGLTAAIVGPIVPASSAEDLLLVDTETNQVTMINSSRPQSLIAFQVEKDKDADPFASSALPLSCGIFDDDVAPESLPYEETSTTGLPAATSQEEGALLEATEVVDETPHYQSYFTSALSSISYPTPSLEGSDAFESAEHVSLPYEVNLPFGQTIKEEGSEQRVSTPDDAPKYLVEAEEPTTVSDNSPIDESSFITLSFLGRLYSANEDSKKDSDRPASAREGSVDQNPSMDFFSTKSETDSSDNEMIEEDLPPDATPQKQEKDAPTPIRTPSHLPDFVWRSDLAEEPRYTPDWETDSEGNEDMESSSTSGEFVWQPGDGSSGLATSVSTADNTSLEWQMAHEKKEEEQSQVSPADEDSESGEEEFTPSTWNRNLTPHRSLLKSPETNSGGKKSVHWKRQRHHRVYEYPPEPLSWHAHLPAPKPRRSWGSHSLDYLTLADWELAGDEFFGDNCEDFEEFYPKGGSNALSASQIYNLGPLTYDNNHGDFYGDECSFFMGSPGSSYAFNSSSFTPAEFFPQEDSGVGSYAFVYTPHDKPEESGAQIDNEISSIQEQKSKSCPEETRFSREKLRLDLPTLCVAETQELDRENENISN